jgi:hypothetical protein
MKIGMAGKKTNDARLYAGIRFGKVDPKNPKTLIVETHTIDYKRQITVYIPAQYVAGSEAPFMV